MYKKIPLVLNRAQLIMGARKNSDNIVVAVALSLQEKQGEYVALNGENKTHILGYKVIHMNDFDTYLSKLRYKALEKKTQEYVLTDGREVARVGDYVDVVFNEKPISLSITGQIPFETKKIDILEQFMDSDFAGLYKNATTAFYIEALAVLGSGDILIGGETLDKKLATDNKRVSVLEDGNGKKSIDTTSFSTEQELLILAYFFHKRNNTKMLLLL